MRFPLLAGIVAGGMACAYAAMAGQPAPWTTADAGQAADTFLKATEPRAASAVPLRLQYARALVEAHQYDLAHKVIAAVVPNLQVSPNWLANLDRGQAIELLAQMGDSHADALIDPAIPFPARADLLGHLGTGAARAGNTALALKTIDRIRAETPADQAVLPIDPPSNFGKQVDLRYNAIINIGRALVSAGAFDRAEAVAKALPADARSDLVADLALGECASTAAYKRAGQAHADQYAAYVKANSPDSEAQKFYRATIGIESLAVCKDAKAAIQFAASMVPDKESDAALDKAAQNLIEKKRLDAAFALDSRPRNGVPANAMQLADRFVKEGHPDAAVDLLDRSLATDPAKPDALSVNQQMIQAALIKAQITAGAYEAMLKRIAPMPPGYRAQYLRMAIEAVADRQDKTVARKLCPLYFKLITGDVPLDPPGLKSSDQVHALAGAVSVLERASCSGEAHKILARAQANIDQSAQDREDNDQDEPGEGDLLAQSWLAAAKASVGDIAGARKSIDLSGTMTEDVFAARNPTRPRPRSDDPAAPIGSRTGPKAAAIENVMRALCDRRDFSSAEAFASEFDKGDGKAAIAAHDNVYVTLARAEFEAGLFEKALAAALHVDHDAQLFLKFAPLRTTGP